MSAKTRVQGFTWTVADHELLSTSDAWGDTLVELAQEDPRVVAVTADLGTTTKLARMRRELPARFVNVGVAEQNLMAVAAGLASTGLTPVVCTYATFAALRAAEFVRTDIAYNGRNVKIVGTLAGVAFGQGGPTHHTLEDLAFLRAIPGLVVLSPRDGDEMCAALRAAVAHEGPVYIRYGRGTEEPIPRTAPFAIGRAELLRDGTDVALLATGVTVAEAMRAADRLERRGISAAVQAHASIAPFDADAVLELATRVPRILSVEDHSVNGGLGGAISEVIASAGIACKVHRLGHANRWLGMGVPEDLMHAGGFDEDAIVAAATSTQTSTSTSTPTPTSTPTSTSTPTFDPDTCRAHVFLTALLPLLERWPDAGRTRGVVSLEVAGTELAARVCFREDGLRIEQGRGEADVRCTWADAHSLARFFAGKASLPRVTPMFGLASARLVARTLALLSKLSVLEPASPRTNARLSPAEKASRVALILALVPRALAALHEAGYPGMRAFAHGSPERIYQWSVTGTDIASHLRVMAGAVSAGPGFHEGRAPFVSFVFADADAAFHVLTSAETSMRGFRAGAVATYGSPEYARKVSILMQEMDAFLAGRTP